MTIMKHIGIAGITVPGALLCIDTILEERYKHVEEGSLIPPHITYTQPPTNEIEVPFEKKDWDQVGEDLLNSITILAKAGVDFAIIPSNSPHYAIKKILSQSSIPILNLVELVVKECQERGFKKTWILGVGVTMSDGLYAKPLEEVGIQPFVLSLQRQKQVNDVIYNEIIKGKPTAQTAEKMKIFIQELKDMGCDSFIAG